MNGLTGLTERQINFAVGFSIIIAIAIILGILILRKDHKYWGNRIFALTFWLFALAIIVNFIYLFSYNTLLIAILNYVSISCINVATISLLLGILIIYKGENQIIQNKLTYLFIFMMLIIILIHGFLPEGVRVEFYVPKWSIMFGMYEIIFGQALFVSILYFSIKLYRDLSPEMQRKFIRFIMGMIFTNISITNIIIKNMNIITGYEPISNILNLTALISVIFIYLGIVRR